MLKINNEDVCPNVANHKLACYLFIVVTMQVIVQTPNRGDVLPLRSRSSSPSMMPSAACQFSFILKYPSHGAIFEI